MTEQDKLPQSGQDEDIRSGYELSQCAITKNGYPPKKCKLASAAKGRGQGILCRREDSGSITAAYIYWKGGQFLQTSREGNTVDCKHRDQ